MAQSDSQVDPRLIKNAYLKIETTGGTPTTILETYNIIDDNDNSTPQTANVLASSQSGDANSYTVSSGTQQVYTFNILLDGPDYVTTRQALQDVSDTVDVSYYPDGNTTGMPEELFNASITGKTVAGSQTSFRTLTLTLGVNGKVTYNTVI